MLLTHDMQLLVEWYHWISAKKGKFQLILFIQDFEGFETTLVVDLISILW